MIRPVAEVPVNPFENIVLSLSGGGYRAAAFHLGVMDLLDRLELLEKVTLLSTVSGGTITGALYAVSNGAGHSYESFYNRAYKFLRETNVIQRALGEMGSGEEERLSLIRAAAQVYAEHLFVEFGDVTFGRLLDAQHTHLKELAFNATEFRQGLSFRFLKSASPRAIFGNKFYPVGEAVARRVRVADVIAASSCFPGAFEPLNFPDDFRWPGQDGLADARRDLGDDFRVEAEGWPSNVTLPLMDGGIYDNQGLESVALAAERATADIGIIIVSDTSQRGKAILEPAGGLREGGVTLSGISWLLRLIFILSCVTVVAVAAKFRGAAGSAGVSLPGYAWQHPYETAFVYAMPLVLAAAVAGLLLWLRALIRRKRCVEVYGTTFDVWDVVRRLSPRDLFGLLRARADSLVAMSSTIFLNRVRAQGFRRFASNPRYQKRTVFNLIYRMNTNHPALFAKEREMEPSAGLADLAARMEKVETKLWVRDEDELRDLIACGQATMCFNLIRHMLKVYGPQVEAHDPVISKVFTNAMEVWVRLKGDHRVLLSRDRPPRPGLD